MSKMSLNIEAGGPEELEDKLLECLRAVSLQQIPLERLVKAAQERCLEEEGLVMTLTAKDEANE